MSYFPASAFDIRRLIVIFGVYCSSIERETGQLRGAPLEIANDTHEV